MMEIQYTALFFPRKERYVQEETDFPLPRFELKIFSSLGSCSITESQNSLLRLNEALINLIYIQNLTDVSLISGRRMNQLSLSIM